MIYKGYTIYAELNQPQRWSLDEEGKLDWFEHEYEIDKDEITYCVEPIDGDCFEDFKTLSEAKAYIDTL